MIDKYDIRPLWVGYDPWNSQYWVKEMEDMGFEMEKIRQGVYTLSEPMKQLEADLRNHALNYNNNPPSQYPSEDRCEREHPTIEAKFKVKEDRWDSGYDYRLCHTY